MCAQHLQLHLDSTTERFVQNRVCVFVQEPAVQLSAREAELLWDGEAVLSVGGGLPQGLPRERGQTTVAQRLDADQVSVCPLRNLCCVFHSGLKCAAHTAYEMWLNQTGACVQSHRRHHDHSSYLRATLCWLAPSLQTEGKQSQVFWGFGNNNVRANLTCSSPQLFVNLCTSAE